MGFAANPSGAFGGMLGAISGGPRAPQAPQPAKIPDYASFQDATQKATSKGSANTFLTGSSGEYLFRTIRPVPYPGRTPHIHMAVRIKGKKELITQCYIQGHELNANDMVYKAIKDPKQRESVTLAFDPLKGSKAGELAARWDVVLGFTPEG